MTRMTAGGPRLRPMHKGGPLAGPALTVKCRPGDNLMIHKALTLAQPGDVIVVDAGGDLTNALFGEIMVATRSSIGVAGVVLNGAVRDCEEIGRGDFPLYAAGVTHRGPYKDGPGEINVPIAIDGMVIHPGDLILGDADGLLCVPFDEAEASAGRHAQEDGSREEDPGGHRRRPARHVLDRRDAPAHRLQPGAACDGRPPEARRPLGPVDRPRLRRAPGPRARRLAGRLPGARQSRRGVGPAGGAHVYHISAAKDELPQEWFASAELLARCPDLLCVSSSGAGYDTVDVAACTAAGVLVVNQAGGNAVSVAEHTLAWCSASRAG
jgi:regulator of RNase E activity RraA